MNAIIGKIDREAFPELNLILWDSAARYIEPGDAFQMYEKRWRYIDSNNLGEEERQLIAQLTDVYGKGLFLA